MTRLFKISLGHWAFASFAFTLTACGVFWAGGVDEEHNTVAGVADEATTDSPIIADDSNINCVTVNDTTICISRNDLNIPHDSVIQVIDTISENPTIIDKGDSIETPVPAEVVVNSYSIKGYVAKDLETNNSIEIALVDTTFYVKGNSDGMFEITVPEGTYSFVVKSIGNSGYVSESNYYLTYGYGSSINVLGPVPTSVASNVDAEDLEAPPVQTVEIPPVTGMTPDPVPTDSSSTGMPPQDTSSNNSDAVILLPNEPDYGLVYHWSEPNIPANESTVNDSLVFANGLEELTFEITFKVNAFPETPMILNKNVFGKKGLFNLAIVRATCHVQEPALAFFIGNGFEFNSCHDKAVVSSATIEVGKEITVTGVWDGKHVMLYKDGFLIAEQTLTKIADINYITADNILETPFVFGDKEMDISIIDARLGNKAISSADVLYRHYLKGGAQ